MESHRAIPNVINDSVPIETGVLSEICLRNYPWEVVAEVMIDVSYLIE